MGGHIDPIDPGTTRPLTDRCIDCGDPTAGPHIAIPGTKRHGSAYWCVLCEAARIQRIGRQLAHLAEVFKQRERDARERDAYEKHLDGQIYCRTTGGEMLL